MLDNTTVPQPFTATVLYTFINFKALQSDCLCELKWTENSGCLKIENITNKLAGCSDNSPLLILLKQDSREGRRMSVRALCKMYRSVANLQKTQNAQPPQRGSGACVMLLGVFCWHSLSPLVPVGGRVTANLKFVVCDHLYLVMKHFYAKGHVVLKDASIRSNGTVWWVWKWWLWRLWPISFKRMVHMYQQNSFKSPWHWFYKFSGTLQEWYNSPKFPKSV